MGKVSGWVLCGVLWSRTSGARKAEKPGARKAEKPGWPREAKGKRFPPHRHLGEARQSDNAHTPGHHHPHRHHHPPCIKGLRTFDVGGAAGLAGARFRMINLDHGEPFLEDRHGRAGWRQRVSWRRWAGRRVLVVVVGWGAALLSCRPRAQPRNVRLYPREEAEFWPGLLKNARALQATTQCGPWQRGR